MTAKLIQWGWNDSRGQSLSWNYWNKNPLREAVLYLLDAGNITPVYDIYRNLKVRRNKR